MAYMLPAARSLFFNASFSGNVNDVKYEHDCTNRHAVHSEISK